MNTFLITENAEFHRSFARYVQQIAGTTVGLINKPVFYPAEKNYRQSARNYMLSFYAQVVHAIECKTINSVSPAETLRRTKVFIDAINPEFDRGIDLNLLSDALPYYPYARALSMLMLAFPEVHWIFIMREKPDTPWAEYHCLKFPEELPTIFQYCPEGYLPLFDPTGFRNGIRQLVNEGVGRMGSLDIPLRETLAAGLDDEDSYAYMNAYTAYRFGYRAWTITNWNLMKSAFRKGREKVHLAFEDLYLSFPDQPSGPEDGQNHAELVERFPDEKSWSISSLEFRDVLLKGFNELDYRVLVTVGHRSSQKYNDRWEKNLAYLKSAFKDRHIILFKPLSGIFDLWRKAGLWGGKRKSPCYAKGFKWPIAESNVLEGSGTHSAPGRLLRIAKTLLDRSEKILRTAETVPDAIHAALLALEAKEILACRTPTTALEALAVQQLGEITAESMFYGIEYNLNVKDRFQEVQREVQAISRWFSTDGSKKSEINARLTIIENLAQRFRELNQFEEEQECLVEARKLRFEFWRLQSWWRILTAPLLWYIRQSVRSAGWLTLLVAGWVVIFSLIYFAANGMANYPEAFSAAAAFFFTLEPINGWGSKEILDSKILWNLVLAFQGLLSFFNLSLLLAIWFSKLSRK